MQITSVHTHVQRWALDGTGPARGRTERASVIVTVETASGHIGLGEAAPLPGMSPDTLEDAQRALAGIAVPFSGVPQLASPSAQFAIETALANAEAAERGCTLAQVLGGTHAWDAAQVVETASQARVAIMAGLTTLKIKVGPDLDLDKIIAIHRAAPEAMLRIDANRSWPKERVRERMFALAELPIEFVEEPCEDALSLVREPLPVPVALDESLATLTAAEIEAALAAPGLGSVVLKPTLVGGIAASLALVAKARAAGKNAVISHALEGVVGFEACRELAAAIGGGVHGLWAHRSLMQFAGPRRIIVATPDRATIEKLQNAIVAEYPFAVLHAKLAPAELARQQRLVETAPLPVSGAILFTSGSTGAARGVLLSRAALEAAAAASAARLGWREGDHWLLALSTAHAGGLAVVVRCRLAGVPVELVAAEGREALAAGLERCTLASLVPTQLAMLLEDPAWRCPRGLRAVLLGGAAAPPALLEEAARRRVPFLVTYGLTESFGQLATAPLDRAGDPSAPLVPLPGVELIAGTRAAPDRIRVRGPMLATCYLDGTPIAPELVTADLGFLEDGALHVVGRADDVIITGGENLHPSQVEAVLAATAGVRAACAFGVADERWGQIIGVAIVTDETFDPAAAARGWHERLPPHARPRRLAVVAGLPLLPGGKVDRRACAALPGEPVRYG